MATLQIPSNVKCITSGQVPTTTNLKDGEFAFGKVGGVAKLYGNVNGVIIDFTGDSADIPYSSSTPFMDGVGSVGSANTVARGDHRHPSDTSRQEKLVSGTNIKTINGQSVLGSGDIKSYPIGSIYISAFSTSPSSLFGGTWEQINGKFLFASDDVLINGDITTAGTYHVGATGGSADAVVVEHVHTFATLVATEVGASYILPATANNYSEIRTTAETYSTGVSGVGKNMPPYLVVYMWKRIA